MRCQGCLSRFKNKSGLWKHLSHSQHAPCKAIYVSQINYLPGVGSADVDSTTVTDNAGNTVGADDTADTDSDVDAADADSASLPRNAVAPTSTIPIPADNGIDRDEPPPEFDGDFFGNDYSAEDFPGWSEPERSDSEGSEDGTDSCGGDEEGETGGDGEAGDRDRETAAGGAVEPAPAVNPAGVTGDGNGGIGAETIEHPPVVNPGQQAGVERAQEQMGKVEIVTFDGLAGKPIRTGEATTTDRYQTRVHGHSRVTNPYAPFKSKTDWEVAKWAKLRGPTSTAVTDLLMIPDVSWS